MKIARPSKPEVPFKRKRSPPPQATKLLTYSLATGIVFMVLLGIVFLPRMFGDQRPVAIVELRLNTTAGTRLDVSTVSAILDLAKFRVNFSRDGNLIGSLGPGLAGGSVNLTFADANGDGLLDPGDYFQIVAAQPGCYRFEIFQVDVDRLVGLELWGGCS